jgi:hypothetical protein
MPFHRSPFAGEALGSVVLARELVLVERDRKIRLTVVGAGLQPSFCTRDLEPNRNRTE